MAIGDVGLFLRAEVASTSASYVPSFRWIFESFATISSDVLLLVTSYRADLHANSSNYA